MAYRPPVELNDDEVEKLAALGCTTDEIGAFFGVSRDTIERRAFPAVLRGRELMKVSLRRKQFELAMQGNPTMLIWLGKQHLDQVDNFSHKLQIERDDVSKLSDADLIVEGEKVLKLLPKPDDSDDGQANGA